MSCHTAQFAEVNVSVQAAGRHTGDHARWWSCLSPDGSDPQHIHTCPGITPHASGIHKNRHMHTWKIIDIYLLFTSEFL